MTMPSSELTFKIPYLQEEGRHKMVWQVLATSHLDRDFQIISKEALDGMAQQINEGPLRQLIEHDVSIPPLGKVTKARVVQLEDGEFALFGKFEAYNIGEQVIVNGEFFTELVVPSNDQSLNPAFHEFVEFPDISFDPKNIPDEQAFQEWLNSLDFIDQTNVSFHSRKSLLPDPEIVMNLGILLGTVSPGVLITYFLGRTGKKTIDTAADNIGSDLGERIFRLYQILMKLPAGFVRFVAGTDRVSTSIAIVPGEPDVILVVKSNDPEVFERAADLSKIAECIERAKQLGEVHRAVEVHFLFSAELEWKINFFVTDTGSTVGSRESIAKQERVRKKIKETPAG
jgi:hypothetical protein